MLLRRLGATLAAAVRPHALSALVRSAHPALRPSSCAALMSTRTSATRSKTVMMPDAPQVAATAAAAASSSSAAPVPAAAAASSAASAASASAPAAFPFSNANSPALVAFASRPSPKGATLLQSIRTSLSAVGTAARAAGQQKYMKSSMAYHGVATPVMRPIFKEAFSTVLFDDAAQWRDAVIHLWSSAQFREERYAAIALARSPRFAAFHTDLPTALPMVAHMITTGAWWDTVDDLASNVLGTLLRAHPQLVSAELTQWSLGDSLWLRRAAICAQLSSKGSDMNLPLLFSLIRPALVAGGRDNDSFWIRKAVGWGLRQAARDPHAVPQIRAFVAQNYHSMSTLSRREALKHLGGDKGPDAVGVADEGAAAAAAAAAGSGSKVAAKGKLKAKKKKQQESDDDDDEDDESEAPMDDDEETEAQAPARAAAAKAPAAKRRRKAAK